MVEITPEDVTRTWPVAAPVRLVRTVRGTNNRSSIVEGDGVTFFLKRYDNAPDHERLAFERQLLAAISAQHPPFAVPEIIPARSGEIVVELDGHRYGLARSIRGDAAQYGNPDDALACGRALADLHVAFEGAGIEPPGRARPPAGELATVHLLVPEPARAIREAVDDAALADQAVAILVAVDRRHALFTTGWPVVLIHWDYYPSNVLVDPATHRVTGIVDFEFAGGGHRAMDVAIGLQAFAFGHPDMEVLSDRFAGGYLSRLPLSQDEIAAMPDLILMREATSLVHWTGRHRQGLTDRADIMVRARRLVDLAAFLTANGADLVHRIEALKAQRPGQTPS